MLKKIGIFIFSILIFSLSFGQSTSLDTIKAMHYNLLYYPSSSSYSAKNANLAPIIQYLQPDILGVNELDRVGGSDHADSILFGALNVNGVTWYARAAHQNTTFSPISNMLFYNSNKFGLASQEEIVIPGERNPNAYHLYYKYQDLGTLQDTIWLHVIEAHLKAGSASADSVARVEITDSIMAYMDRKGPGNWLMMGDLNLYTSNEAAYQNLINYAPNMSVDFNDPINMPGDWHINGAFASVHTQSTRIVSESDGGISGGMDDRFDFILPTDNVMSGTDSVRYITGTYQAVGQDGLRYNQAINSPANTLVPVNIADALYWFSDHLPVTAEFEVRFPFLIGVDDQSGSPVVRIWPNPANDKIMVDFDQPDWNWELCDLRGLKLSEGSSTVREQAIDLDRMVPGIYMIKVYSEGYSSWNRIVIAR